MIRDQLKPANLAKLAAEKAAGYLIPGFSQAKMLWDVGKFGYDQVQAALARDAAASRAHYRGKLDAAVTERAARERAALPQYLKDQYAQNVANNAADLAEGMGAYYTGYGPYDDSGRSTKRQRTDETILDGPPYTDHLPAADPGQTVFEGPYVQQRAKRARRAKRAVLDTATLIRVLGSSGAFDEAPRRRRRRAPCSPAPWVLGMTPPAACPPLKRRRRR